jgi:hypothetical protein
MIGFVAGCENGSLPRKAFGPALLCEYGFPVHEFLSRHDPDGLAIAVAY